MIDLGVPEWDDIDAMGLSDYLDVLEAAYIAQHNMTHEEWDND